MVDKIEMSLDDIIKTSKSSGGVKRGPQAGGARRGGKGGFRGGSSRGAPNGNVRSGNGGGVQKGRNRGGGIVKPKFARGDVNSAWKHDMFDGPRRRAGGAGGSVGGGGSGAPATGTTKLLVSNLDYGVSESDIKELFADFGPLRSASVHYDRSGRSLGTAHVIFERRGDAVKAMKQYNGVPLDGRPMNIQLPTSDVPAAPTARTGGAAGGARKPLSPKRPLRGGRGPPRGGARRVGGGGGGGAGAGGKRTPKPAMTAEQLDAELDAYVKDMK